MQSQKKWKEKKKKEKITIKIWVHQLKIPIFGLYLLQAEYWLMVISFLLM